MGRRSLGWGIGLVAFGLVPLGLIAPGGGGGTLTGATGIFAADQLQYLAWVRDLGTSLLARNSFDLAPSSHVFVEPVFALSGALVRLGVSPAWAYDLWLPVAAVALALAYRSYTHRLVAQPAALAAALLLALFATSPLAPLLDSVAGLSPGRHNQLALAVADLTPALQLWGYFPIAIALALVCVSLLAVERAIDPARRAPGRAARSELLLAGVSGALAAWLHPWQGATLLLILGGLWVTERTRRAALVYGGVSLAVCLPLAYYLALGQLDEAWSAARSQNDAVSFEPWAIAATLGPLALAALAGARRPGREVQERVLVIWPLAALALYLLDPPYAIHALETATLPLAILAVRGGRRLRLNGPAAVVLILLATEPGLIFAGTLLDKALDEHRGGYLVSRDDARALRALERSPSAGGVLAPTPIASAVPAYTGRATWLGHPSWTPGYRRREAEANRLFSGRMSEPAARRLVASSGARFVLAPCGSSPAIGRIVRSLTSEGNTRFGCATLIKLAQPHT